jgi:hypothetical protein
MVHWDVSGVGAVAQYVLPKPPPPSEVGPTDAVVEGTHALAASVREAGMAIGIGAPRRRRRRYACN